MTTYNHNSPDVAEPGIMQLIGKWINRLHYKTTWKKYINDEMSYSEFKEYVYYITNTIRKVTGVPMYSMEKFEEGWSYRTVCHENYKVAYEELFNLIFGWW